MNTSRTSLLSTKGAMLLAASLMTISLSVPAQNAVVDLCELGTVHPGFRIDGIDRYDNSGSSVSGAGDVNGDGFADVVIGALGPFLLKPDDHMWSSARARLFLNPLRHRRQPPRRRMLRLRAERW